MKQWWDENWPFVVFILVCSFIFFCSYLIDSKLRDEYNLRFNECYKTMHNVYACNRYANGDTNFIVHKHGKQ